MDNFEITKTNCFTCKQLKWTVALDTRISTNRPTTKGIVNCFCKECLENYRQELIRNKSMLGEYEYLLESMNKLLIEKKTEISLKEMIE
ncbi:hypothetical protein [endosymbiont GvMRE of Glomus versiforme]|uniref:hypothetical protein n=1 Tax=endosymbiont GvMRE of Glomus versiforme TaxID=2039283 RepID=UPI000ECB9FEA|nr:hypothetical protein [endosymbiont GvMRE of Glomus versiforme]RHZ36820.1 hypothetical protein GvMRE_I2g49 [endosymbiont GvMRE of Glomus versiforme]